MNKFIGCDG